MGREGAWCAARDPAHALPMLAQVSEQAALGQFNQLQARIASLERDVAAQREAAAQLQARLEGQLSINRQLMAKKEDVEWQLMAALAKVCLVRARCVRRAGPACAYARACVPRTACGRSLRAQHVSGTGSRAPPGSHVRACVYVCVHA